MILLWKGASAPVAPRLKSQGSNTPIIYALSGVPGWMVDRTKEQQSTIDVIARPWIDACLKTSECFSSEVIENLMPMII